MTGFAAYFVLILASMVLGVRIVVCCVGDTFLRTIFDGMLTCFLKSFVIALTDYWATE